MCCAADRVDRKSVLGHKAVDQRHCDAGFKEERGQQEVVGLFEPYTATRCSFQFLPLEF